MASPDKWPHWPMLPLIKDFGENRKYGTLVETTKGFAFVEDTNIYDPRSFANKTDRTGGEELLQQLVEEGWFVD